MAIGKWQAKTRKSCWRAWAAVVESLSAILMTSVTGCAQVCPYCYANAAAQTPGMLQALRTGILVILLPCLAMFIVIFAVAYRRRRSFNAEPLYHAVESEGVGGWEIGPAK